MPELMIKNLIPEIKVVDDKRTLNVTFTTDTIDRAGDIIEPKGVKLTNYRKNPVVLLAHDYHGLPIGRAENIEKTEHGITADVVFPEEGIYPLADTVYQMYKQKFIRAWSIGFIPIKTEDIVDEEGDSKNKDNTELRRRGKRIKSCDMLEFSGCSVGANPDALNNMIAKGINIDTLKEAGFIEIEDEKSEEDTDKDIVTKPEETDDNIRIPAKGESGKHTDKENEINEIIKENKELKERFDNLELKIGAVLNKKNKGNLKNAQDLIQEVLDSAGSEEENSIDIDDEEDDDIKIDIKDSAKDNIKDDLPKKNNEVKDEEEDEKIEIEENILEKIINNKFDYIIGKVQKNQLKK